MRAPDRACFVRYTPHTHLCIHAAPPLQKTHLKHTLPFVICTLIMHTLKSHNIWLFTIEQQRINRLLSFHTHTNPEKHTSAQHTLSNTHNRVTHTESMLHYAHLHSRATHRHTRWCLHKRCKANPERTASAHTDTSPATPTAALFSPHTNTVIRLISTQQYTNAASDLAASALETCALLLWLWKSLRQSSLFNNNEKIHPSIQLLNSYNHNTHAFPQKLFSSTSHLRTDELAHLSLNQIEIAN